MGKHGQPGMHPVLNIDTVVRILAERLRCDDWSEILIRCLPTRHQAGPTSRELRHKRCRESKALVEQCRERKALVEGQQADHEDDEGCSGSEPASGSECSPDFE